MSLPDTMMAVVVHGKEDYRMEEVAVPQPGPGEVLVKVEAVGICAGDAKTFTGAERFWGNGADVPQYVEPPVIPGHEFSGRVVALGEGAAELHGVAIGDLTVSEQIVPCQDCKYCGNGNYQMCVPHHVYGFHQVTPGAMTSYLIYPSNALVHKVPDHVDPKHACFVEPFACSLHAVDLGQIGWDDVVVISGCGPLGLGMVAGAKKKDPKCIVALDLVDWKLDIARKCGADVVLNPLNCNLTDEINKLTEGLGCDVYIEATGAGPSVKQGLSMLARMGRSVNNLVNLEGDTKELTIVGGHLGPKMWPKAIAMIAAGELPMEDIISHTFPLKEFRKGIDQVISGKESVKVMLIP